MLKVLGTNPYLGDKKYDTVEELLDDVDVESIKENKGLTPNEKLILYILRFTHLNRLVNDNKLPKSYAELEQSLLFNEIKALLKKMADFSGYNFVELESRSHKGIASRVDASRRAYWIGIPESLFCYIPRETELKWRDEVIVGAYKRDDVFVIYASPLKCPVLNLIKRSTEAYLFLVTESDTKRIMYYYSNGDPVHEFLYNFVRNKCDCKISGVYYLSLPSHGINNIPNIDSIDVIELAEIIKKATQVKEKKDDHIKEQQITLKKKEEKLKEKEAELEKRAKELEELSKEVKQELKEAKALISKLKKWAHKSRPPRRRRRR